MQWVQIFLLLTCLATAPLHAAQKPTHGVEINLTVTTVTSQTACVFVSLNSAQPIELLSVHWLQGEWIEDTTVHCEAIEPSAHFSAQIPTEHASEPVQVQATWQLDNDVFTAIQSTHQHTLIQSRKLSRQPTAPVDTDELFIIRIGD